MTLFPFSGLWFWNPSCFYIKWENASLIPTVTVYLWGRCWDWSAGWVCVCVRVCFLLILFQTYQGIWRAYRANHRDHSAVMVSTHSENLINSLTGQPLAPRVRGSGHSSQAWEVGSSKSKQPSTQGLHLGPSGQQLFHRTSAIVFLLVSGASWNIIRG